MIADRNYKHIQEQLSSISIFILAVHKPNKDYFNVSIEFILLFLDLESCKIASNQQSVWGTNIL